MTISNSLKIAFLQLIIFSQVTLGQSIIRSSLSCLGSTISENGLMLRQTIGQSSSTLLFARDGSALIQGFQQPIGTFNTIEQVIPIDLTLSPNPASGKVLLKFKEDPSPYTITIRNIYGVMLEEIKDQTSESNWLGLTNYPPGIYIITITVGNRVGSRKLIITN